MRPFGRISMVLFAAGCLAACTEVVDLTTESRYAQYNRTTDWAKNEAILLNIIRASEKQPLNFLVYQAYTGTATASATAASPGFIIGPARTASQKQFTFSNSTLSVAGSGTGSISVQNLDTQDFYDALLSPVDFTNLYAFQRQGYPRELLFRLFTDFVSLKPPQSTDPQGRGAYIIYNEPGDKRCYFLNEKDIHHLYPTGPVGPAQRQICFEDLVDFALLSGLTSEIRAVAAPSGSDNKQSSSGGGAQPKGGNTTSNSASSSNSQKPATEGRLCFDGALANRARMDYASAHPDMMRFLDAVRMAEYHPVCGGTGPHDIWSISSTKGGAAARDAASGSSSLKSNASAGTNTISVSLTVPTRRPVWDLHLHSQDNVEIGTRSTFSIYNFLGVLMNNQNDAINELKEPDPNDDPHILTVIKGAAVGCFSSVGFDLGVYCVPIDGAANTKRTFSILSQLLALKTTTGDLQLQPIFRLQPQ
jgi:hypothetical protein